MCADWNADITTYIYIYIERERERERAREHMTKHLIQKCYCQSVILHINSLLFLNGEPV